MSISMILAYFTPTLQFYNRPSIAIVFILNGLQEVFLRLFVHEFELLQKSNSFLLHANRAFQNKSSDAL